MWKIDYYTRRSGRCPAQDFIEEDLEPHQQVRVMKNIERLKVLGNKAEFPLIRKLENGFYELRTKVVRTQIRILYFFFQKDTIVFTNGFKEQKDDALQDEIGLAYKYKQDYYDQRRGAL